MPVEGRDDEVVVVTIVKSFASYNIGETAAFLPEHVAELVEQGFVVEGASTGAPLNATVPYASQAGAVLSCTMGNWIGEPTSYSYQWQLDGADAGTDSATYDVAPEDAGKSATCIVTATNDVGSTAAPPSNAVVVT